jgi:hypothetical protein
MPMDRSGAERHVRLGRPRASACKQQDPVSLNRQGRERGVIDCGILCGPWLPSPGQGVPHDIGRCARVPSPARRLSGGRPDSKLCRDHWARVDFALTHTAS